MNGISPDLDDTIALGGRVASRKAWERRVRKLYRVHIEIDRPLVPPTLLLAGAASSSPPKPF
jgi:hypothetical protein